MTASTDGGQIAVTGFILQAVVAILEGLSRDDWYELEVEPVSETRDYEKVDIRWCLVDGSEEHVQVKHSRNPFGRPDVERWAGELAERTPNHRHRLMLLGAASTTARRAELPPTVSLDYGSEEVDIGFDAVAHRLGDFCERQGVVVRASDARKAADVIAGLFLVGSATSRTWTPDQLRQDVLYQCRPLADTLQPTASGLETSVYRIIFIGEDECVDEHIYYTLSNTGTASVQEYCVQINLTDHDRCDILRVTDGGNGETEPFWRANDSSNPDFWFGVRIPEPIRPGDVRTAGAHFRRTGVVERVSSGMLVFRCPLLRVPEVQRAKVVVIFPGSGIVQADRAWTTTTNLACWKTTVSNANKSITAVFDEEPISAREHQIDLKLFRLYKRLAELFQVRPLPMSEIHQVEDSLSSLYLERKFIKER